MAEQGTAQHGAQQPLQAHAVGHHHLCQPRCQAVAGERLSQCPRGDGGTDGQRSRLGQLCLLQRLYGGNYIVERRCLQQDMEHEMDGDTPLLPLHGALPAGDGGPRRGAARRHPDRRPFRRRGACAQGVLPFGALPLLRRYSARRPLDAAARAVPRAPSAAGGRRLDRRRVGGCVAQPAGRAADQVGALALDEGRLLCVDVLPLSLCRRLGQCQEVGRGGSQAGNLRPLSQHGRSGRQLPPAVHSRGLQQRHEGVDPHHRAGYASGAAPSGSARRR